eukprot:TRINITY_DN10864_c0_g1_i1.p1 TRINITY_DN10864_c0_g1~~TRINITY_DN10864_c0_g1_i1.p1  ORF type:complete len:289 (-),score=45.44 TRINITY_DN10864_c0_g1_i1:38-904(-)
MTCDFFGSGVSMEKGEVETETGLGQEILQAELEARGDMSAALETLLEALLSKSELNDQELQQVDQLSDIDKTIFYAMMERKNSQNSGKGRKKREEELNKFVLKKAFKQFTRQVANYCKPKRSQKRKANEKNQRNLYEFYFRKTAMRLKISIENFFLPNRSKNPKLKSGLQSLNASYINLVLNSDEFRAKLKQFVTEELLQGYRAKRPQKMRKLLQSVWRWCKRPQVKMIKDEMNAKGFTPASQDVDKEAVRKYILANSKAKIPWSDFEVREATDHILQIITSFELEHK